MGYFDKFFCTSGRMGVWALNVVDDEKKYEIGANMTFSDNEREVEASYMQAGAGGILAGTVCVEMGGKAAVPVPNTANLGKSACVAATDIEKDKFGWFLTSGLVPVLFNANSTVDGKAYIGAAGVATPTAATGKQIVGVNTLEGKTITGTGTVLCSVKNPFCQGQVS